MIKFNEFGEHLRLGNLLYLYAGIKSLAKKAENDVVFPSHYMWQYFEIEQKTTENKDYNELFHLPMGWNEEKQQNVIDYFSANKDKILNINNGSNLQSEKWFDKEYTKKLLTIKPEHIDGIKDKYNSIFTRPTIGIGIRRGDFVKHGVFYQIPENWYENALKDNFPNWNEYNIVVFSDDIEWCKDYYAKTNLRPFMHFAEPNNTHTHKDGFKHYRKDPFEQFILASQMDNFVGGSSTFSWWNMWVIKNFNNGKVVHCGKNLSVQGEKQFGVNEHYYPDDWICTPC